MATILPPVIQSWQGEPGKIRRNLQSLWTESFFLTCQGWVSLLLLQQKNLKRNSQLHRLEPSIPPHTGIDLSWCWCVGLRPVLKRGEDAPSLVFLSAVAVTFGKGIRHSSMGGNIISCCCNQSREELQVSLKLRKGVCINVRV